MSVNESIPRDVFMKYKKKSLFGVYRIFMSDLCVFPKHKLESPVPENQSVCLCEEGAAKRKMSENNTAQKNVNNLWFARARAEDPGWCTPSNKLIKLCLQHLWSSFFFFLDGVWWMVDGGK